MGIQPVKTALMAANAPAFTTCVINLDRSTERLARMSDELTRAGLPWQRVPGLLAKDLPPELRKHFTEASGAPTSSLTAGEIGCFAAHLCAIAKAVSGDGPPATLILEDDCHLPANLGDLIDELLQALPSDWDLVRLCNIPKSAYVPLRRLGGGHELILYSKAPNFAGAYLVSRAGARKLLRPGLKTMAFDEFLRRPWLHRCKSFGVWPPFVTQQTDTSDIDTIEPRGRSASGGVRKHLQKTRLGDLGRRMAWQWFTLGWRNWLACSTINVANKIAKRLSLPTPIHRASSLLGPDREPNRRPA